MTLGRNTNPGRYLVRPLGGLNDYDRPISVDGTAYTYLKNVSFRRLPTIAGRDGVEDYAVTTAITDNIKGMHRFKDKAGTSEIMLFTDANDVLTDTSDDGDFDSGDISSGTMGTVDGFLRFVQWGDCALYASESYDLESYNSAETIDAIKPTMRDHNSGRDAGLLFYYLTVATGIQDLQSGKDHEYRFTAEIYHGDTFLGETYPLMSGQAVRAAPMETGRHQWENLQHTFMQATVNTTANQKVEFRKGWKGSTNAWPLGAKYINVYRRGLPEDATSGALETKLHYDFWFVGQFSVAGANDVSLDPGTAGGLDGGGTSDGGVIFEDDGGIPLNRQMSYLQSMQVPKARFLEVHKNRLWLGYVVEYEGSAPAGGSVETTHQDRVYFSEPGAPFQIPLANWINVKPAGEGLTGIKSFANRMLLLFSTDSVTAVLGGDDELAPGVPNLYMDVVSAHIGCIAPNSISWTDGGMAWLSERGPVIFDGESIQPLGRTRGTRGYIDAIPKARRYHAVGWYDKKEGEYCLAYTYDDGDTGADLYNRYVDKYSFVTGTWTREKHSKGIGAAVVIADTDQDDYVLLGREDSTLVNYSAVVKADAQNGDGGASGGTDAVSIEFRTGWISCESPDEDKDFKGVFIEYRSPADITIDVMCKSVTEKDGTAHEIDTRDVGEASFTLDASTSATEDDIYYVSFDERIWGKRIQLIFTVSTSGAPPEIHSTELVYSLKGGRK
jgi:hypothetical protein